MPEMKTISFPNGKSYEIVDEKAREDIENLIEVQDKPEIQIPDMSDMDKKTEKVQIEYLGNKVFKHNGETLNFSQIYNYHMISPDFTFIVYGNRAYLCSFVDYESNPRQMRFDSVINAGNMTKVSSIYLTSNDGVSITNTTVSDINNENSSNKVSAIADTNKSNTTYYPSNKAVTDYVDFNLQTSITGKLVLDWTIGKTVSTQGVEATSAYYALAERYMPVDAGDKFIRMTPAKDASGISFLILIVLYDAQKVLLDRISMTQGVEYEISENAKYARFVLGRVSSTGVMVSEEDIKYFDVRCPRAMVAISDYEASITMIEESITQIEDINMQRLDEAIDSAAASALSAEQSADRAALISAEVDAVVGGMTQTITDFNDHFLLDMNAAFLNNNLNQFLTIDGLIQEDGTTTPTPSIKNAYACTPYIPVMQGWIIRVDGLNCLAAYYAIAVYDKDKNLQQFASLHGKGSSTPLNRSYEVPFDGFVRFGSKKSTPPEIYIHNVHKAVYGVTQNLYEPGMFLEKYGIGGYTEEGSTVYRIASSSARGIAYAKCKPNTTYTISNRNTSGTNVFMAYWSELAPADGAECFGRLSTNGGTLTTGENAAYILVLYERFPDAADPNFERFSIMIEEGLSMSEFVPRYTAIDYVARNLGCGQERPVYVAIGASTTEGYVHYYEDGESDSDNTRLSQYAYPQVVGDILNLETHNLAIGGTGFLSRKVGTASRRQNFMDVIYRNDKALSEAGLITIQFGYGNDKHPVYGDNSTTFEVGSWDDYYPYDQPGYHPFSDDPEARRTTDIQEMLSKGATLFGCLNWCIRYISENYPKAILVLICGAPSANDESVSVQVNDDGKYKIVCKEYDEIGSISAKFNTLARALNLNAIDEFHADGNPFNGYSTRAVDSNGDYILFSTVKVGGEKVWNSHPSDEGYKLYARWKAGKIAEFFRHL